MFGGFGANPGTTQTTSFGATGGWPQDPTHQSISHSSSFQQAERSARILPVQQACSVPKNLPLVLVQLERLVQPGSGPQLALLPRVHLASRAQALQEVLETPVFLVPSRLHLEQVSTLPGSSKPLFRSSSSWPIRRHWKYHHGNVEPSLRRIQRKGYNQCEHHLGVSEHNLYATLPWLFL